MIRFLLSIDNGIFLSLHKMHRNFCFFSLSEPFFILFTLQFQKRFLCLNILLEKTLLLLAPSYIYAWSSVVSKQKPFRVTSLCWLGKYLFSIIDDRNEREETHMKFLSTMLIMMHNIAICYSKYLLRFFLRQRFGTFFDMLTHLRARALYSCVRIGTDFKRSTIEPQQAQPF